MNTIVTKIFSFCYAHQLPEHKGKCKRIHGHNAVLEISIMGKINKKTGMVIDFGDISKITKNLIGSLDHNYLNGVIPSEYLPPTAENICGYLWEMIKPINNENMHLYKIKFYETPTSFVERIQNAEN